ncbi:DNA methyltransferase [Paraburkholderia tropica]|uniref:DNA-methyltransferase n=1 Tax=Paraburkholderia tropica TaxID=92647 RepID=UPI0032B4E8D4
MIEQDGRFTLRLGDCVRELRALPDSSVDSVVTDPPYELGFMGRAWDSTGIANDPAMWAECLRVLKPGGHLLAFSSARTFHRMACAVEDAGFEIRDQIMWLYSSGMPKSLDVSKAIDKLDAAAARSERALRFTAWLRDAGFTARQLDEITGSQMGGHYTTAASQPAVATREHFELIRPHLACSVPDWVEQLVDERSVESENFKRREVVGQKVGVAGGFGDVGHGGPAQIYNVTTAATPEAKRWEGWGTALKPAHEPICVARKPFRGVVAENVLTHGTGALNIDACRVGERWPANVAHDGLAHEWAPFFYSPKASRADRGDGNVHPTVKPVELMRYLCRLVTPPGGVVLDPFMGSGSTGKAAMYEGFRFIGIERERPYMAIAERRIANACVTIR